MKRNIDILQAGQKVGVFEILRPLHQGGQATVYLVRLWQPDQMTWQQLLQRIDKHGATQQLIEQHKLCALKIANPGSEDHLINEWDFLQRPNIRHERLIMTSNQRFGNVFSTRRQTDRQSNSPEYVDLTNRQGEVVSVPSVALAYEPGGSLKQLLEERNYEPLPPSCAVQVAIQVGEALQHLHEQVGLVHHDVTPSNILLRQRPVPLWGSAVDVVVTDLAAADSLDNPRLRQVFGKRAYLPAERLRQLPDSISPQVDIYSLGIVLYEMLGGRLPEQNTQELSNIEKQLDPIHTRANVSGELNMLVMWAIERDVQRRTRKLPTMRDMVEKLREVPEAHQTCRLRGTWAQVDVKQWFMRAAAGMLAIMAVAIVAMGSMIMLDGSVEAGDAPTVTITRSGAHDEPTVTPLPPTASPRVRHTPSPQPSSTRSPDTSSMISTVVPVRRSTLPISGED